MLPVDSLLNHYIITTCIYHYKATFAMQWYKLYENGPTGFNVIIL